MILEILGENGKGGKKAMEKQLKVKGPKKLLKVETGPTEPTEQDTTTSRPRRSVRGVQARPDSGCAFVLNLCLKNRGLL